MGAIILDQTLPANLPLPDAGTAYFFLDADNVPSVKTPSGAILKMNGKDGAPGLSAPAGLGRRVTARELTLAVGVASQSFLSVALGAGEWAANQVATLGIVIQTTATAAGSLSLQWRVNGGAWLSIMGLAIPATAGQISHVKGQIALTAANNLLLVAENAAPVAATVAAVQSTNSAVVNPGAAWSFDFALVGTGQTTALSVRSVVLQM